MAENDKVRALRAEIVALERKLGMAEEPTETEDDGKDTVMAQIAELEKQLAFDDMPLPEPVVDELPPVVEDLDLGLDVDPFADDLELDLDVACRGCNAADETEEVEEDESEEDVKAADENVDEHSEKVNRFEEVQGETDSKVKTEEMPKRSYVERLVEASARLDRVASYLEKTGNKKLAFRIDQLADAIDAERKSIQS